MSAIFQKLCFCCFKQNEANRVPSAAYKNPMAGELPRGNTKHLQKELKKELGGKNSSGQDRKKTSSFRNEAFDIEQDDGKNNAKDKDTENNNNNR